MSAPTSLIVFTRFPVAGKAKTRLIPAVGAEGAAQWQRDLTEQVVGRAWSFAAARKKDVRLVVAYDGGTHKEMRGWLGDLTFHEQGEGDLGERMARAIKREHESGSEHVIVMGADCPGITEAIIGSAIDALAEVPLTFGPAEDGGYYLVGLRTDAPDVFHEMDWGTEQVLAESLKRAEGAGVNPALLETLSDVDIAEDLPEAERSLTFGKTVSVVLPVLSEAGRLPALLKRLGAGQPLEIIVADGGSDDGSAAVAREHGARVVESERGRAKQLNAGAKIARGEYLLFLHADTEPPDDYVQIVTRTLRPGVTGGAFAFALDGELKLKNTMEKMVAWRCRTFQLPYGDQGLFVRRALFDAVGGYPDIPIMEDIELVRTLYRLGKVEISPEYAITSSRRWREGGVIRTFFRHQFILIGHLLGCSAKRLRKLRD